jgi:hypothetical protein
VVTTGDIFVTLPQDIALINARKGIFPVKAKARKRKKTFLQPA